MVRAAGWTQDCWLNHSSWCGYTLEFDVWHVEICAWVPQGNRHLDSGQAEWPPELRVEKEGMDNCSTIVWHPQGRWSKQSTNHWLIILALWSAQVLKDATLFFLCSTPNLATVIPAMDFINDTLTAHAHNQALSPAIKALLELRKKTLNWYYLLTDSSEVYQITMGMSARILLYKPSHSTLI